MAPDLYAISDVLNQQENNIVFTARRNLLEQISGSFSELTVLHPPLLQLFRRLPIDAVERLISAPETFRLLIMAETDERRDEVLRFLETAVRVELQHAGIDAGLDGRHWSVLGDVCYEFNTRKNNPTLVAGQCMSHTLIMDGRSPAVSRPQAISEGKTWQFNALRQPTDDEYATVCEKTTLALDTLRDRSPAFYTLIQVHVKTVLVKSDDGGYFTSSSNNAEIGRMALFNAHLEGMSLAQIMTALVHEAIHSFLYCIEQKTPLTLLKPEADKVALTSPWTGGKLSLHSYIHAFFVWWGVARLWHIAGDEKPESMRATITSIRENALRGFDGDRVLTDLEPHRDSLAPDLMTFLASVVGRGATPKVAVPWI